MVLALESYNLQASRWPSAGRHVLSQHDDDAVVVYQAFRPGIADEAVAMGRFGPSFSRSRMSWIKPNFLWMMYRCGWATKPDQERVLAVRIRRSFFEALLERAVWSSFTVGVHRTEEEWRAAVSSSDVRLQWDPDHAPNGTRLERRAIQLGLRGSTLAEYSEEALLGMEDVTPLVASQRRNAIAPYADLVVPVERVLVPRSAAAVLNVRLDPPPASITP